MHKDNDADILPPDWSYWGSLKTVTLFQAVLLSFDICPDWFATAAKNPCFRLSDELSDELDKCLRICENRAIEFDSWLALFSEENRSRGNVNLAAFGSWARTVWDDLPNEFPGLEDKSEEGSAVAKCHTAEACPADPATKAEVFAPRIGWQIALFDAWPKMRTTYGREPSALEAIRYLKKHDDSGCILQKGGDRELWWKPDRGAVKEVQFKTVESCISSWRTSGKLPA